MFCAKKIHNSASCCCCSSPPFPLPCSDSSSPSSSSFPPPPPSCLPTCPCFISPVPPSSSFSSFSSFAPSPSSCCCTSPSILLPSSSPFRFLFSHFPFHVVSSLLSKLVLHPQHPQQNRTFCLCCFNFGKENVDTVLGSLHILREKEGEGWEEVNREKEEGEGEEIGRREKRGERFWGNFHTVNISFTSCSCPSPRPLPFSPSTPPSPPFYLPLFLGLLSPSSLVSLSVPLPSLSNYPLSSLLSLMKKILSVDNDCSSVFPPWGEDKEEEDIEQKEQVIFSFTPKPPSPFPSSTSSLKKLTNACKIGL